MSNYKNEVEGQALTFLLSEIGHVKQLIFEQAGTKKIYKFS